LPVIPATQEEEIRRLTVAGQPRQKVYKIPMSTNKIGVVGHACNPSYIGRRDQEDHSSKPAGANSSKQKQKTIHKRAGGVAQGEGPEFKPQYHAHTQTQKQQVSGVGCKLP
jgi:hypothetical protein